MEETIYFVRTANIVKIGYTTNLKTRLRALQTTIEWSGATLTLMHSMPGDLVMESELHKHFDKHRVQLESWREWFYLRDELKEFLESVGCNCEDYTKRPTNLSMFKRSDVFGLGDDKIHEPSVSQFWIPRQGPDEVLKELMKNSGVNQKKVASLLKCNQSNVSHFMNGNQRLTAEQIDALARHFNCPHSLFFGVGTRYSA